MSNVHINAIHAQTQAYSAPSHAEMTAKRFRQYQEIGKFSGRSNWIDDDAIKVSYLGNS